VSKLTLVEMFSIVVEASVLLVWVLWGCGVVETKSCRRIVSLAYLFNTYCDAIPGLSFTFKSRKRHNRWTLSAL
jgi:hypothetical protein